MTSNILPSSNKNKDLINRLIVLEKFLELKSNECAYYRTKVHLMQMSSLNSPITNKNSVKQENKNSKRSSSEDISQSSITSRSQSNSIDRTHRRSSLPLSSQRKSTLKKNLHVPHSIPFNQSKRRHRKEIHSKTHAQNQNYYEEMFSHSKQKSSSSKNDKNLIEQIVISTINKHLQQSSSSAHDKNIQCNDNDFHPIKTSLKSENTVLMIRLPRRFIKSLIAQQKKPTASKLKVHISPELLKKLFQSIHLNSKSSKENQFTIQSQFGAISACINHEDKQEFKAIHAKAEVKTHRLPQVRHIARTRSDGSDRKKVFIEKNRRKKRHIYKSNSTSHEEIYSKRSSLTNVTQTIETLPSSDQTSNSISFENQKIKRNKRRF